MTVPHDPSTFDIVKDIGIPLAAGIIGWFANQIWMSKKDRKDVEQKNFENATKMRDDHDTAYVAYLKALSDYTNAPDADPNHFVEIARGGDRYFLQLNFLCAAILSDKVDGIVRDDVMLAKIQAAAERTLPSHYKTLSEIADRHGFSHPAEFRREDYSALFGVIEKFGQSPGWT